MVTALQRLCQKVSNHFFGGTPMDADLLHIHLVTNKEVLNVDVPGVFAAQGLHSCCLAKVDSR